MSNAADVLKQIDKEHGAGIATSGVNLPEMFRIPTGIFDFDSAIGGGFPAGRASILYGPESSMKSTMAMKAVAYAQQHFPEQQAVWVDLEGTYDPVWAAQMGVDNDRLIFVMPDYAEQAIDIIDGMLYATDVSLIVIDSLAAFVPINEINSSAEKQIPGGAGLLIAKFYRKATLAMSKARRMGYTPTLIAINQTRYKIGVMFGDPETMPGGQSFKFFSSLTIRTYGKDVMEKKIHSGLPAYKHVSGVVKKQKIGINARTFKFDMALVNNPKYGLKVGQSDEWKPILRYIKEFGLLEKAAKAGGGWNFLDENYKNQDAIRTRLLEDDEFSTTVRTLIYDTLSSIGGIPPDEND